MVEKSLASFVTEAGKISKPQKHILKGPGQVRNGVLEHWSNLQYERENGKSGGRLYRFIIGHNHNRYSKTVSTTIDRFDILTLFILMQKFAQCINTSC